MNKKLTFLLALTFLFFVGCGGEEVKKEYYETGELYKETHYKNGQKEGLGTEWYENGKKRIEYHYKNGAEDGVTTYWYETGEKSGEIHFKDNHLDGMQTSWYKNGKKQSERQWKDDRLWLVTNWDEDGNMTNQYDNKGDQGE